MATPSPDTPAHSAMGRARSAASVNTFVRIDRVAGITNAAPKPRRARKPMSAVAESTSEQANDPAPKITRPTMKQRLRPRRSPVLPATSKNPAKTMV